jgi:hypothetical protein
MLGSRPRPVPPERLHRFVSLFVQRRHSGGRSAPHRRVRHEAARRPGHGATAASSARGRRRPPAAIAAPARRSLAPPARDRHARQSANICGQTAELRAAARQHDRCRSAMPAPASTSTWRRCSKATPSKSARSRCPRRASRRGRRSRRAGARRAAAVEKGWNIGSSRPASRPPRRAFTMPNGSSWWPPRSTSVRTYHSRLAAEVALTRCWRSAGPEARDHEDARSSRRGSQPPG